MPTQASTGDEPEITIFVSCYNEEDFITNTIDHVANALKATGHTFEVIVVDDVSKDRSVQRVQEYMRAHPDYLIRLVQNKTNKGLANNYVEAAFLGRGKYYRLCVGDDSEEPEALENLFQYIGVADIVVPYQIQDEIVGKTWSRRRISNLFTFLVNTISGYDIKYYNGMAIHLRYNVMRWHPSSYGFGFQADILTRLLDEGASYVQVRSYGTDRKGAGSTSINLRNFLSVTHTLLELAIRRIRRFMYGKNMTKPVEVSATLPAKVS